MTNPTICDIFDQMDRDRHLAGYPLENRASPFFRQFLHTAFKTCLNITLNSTVIPELPYQKNEKGNGSPKVDFFALSEDGKCAFLIELKTDMGSLKGEQAQKLRKASERGTHEILSDLMSMANTNDKPKRQKYFHMLKALENLKLIREMPSDLEDVMYQPDSGGVFGLLKQIKIKSDNLCPKIVYILPRPPTSKKEKKDVDHLKSLAEIIYFQEFADAIKRQGEIGERFAKSLLEWAELDPGTRPPAKP